MINITLLPEISEFAENKDIARQMRIEKILPAIERKEMVVLDFHGVRYATQSFMHALINECLERFGESALDYIQFKNCTTDIQIIIETVVGYSLDPPVIQS
jgi:hypothetical protein